MARGGIKVKLEGMDDVMRKLTKEIKKLGPLSIEGVTKAGELIRRDAMKNAPVVTGNLKNSAYMVVTKSDTVGKSASFKGKDAGDRRSDHQKAISESKGDLSRNDAEAIVGFSAAYAVYVHENKRAGQTGGVSPKGVQYKPEKGSTRKVYSTVGGWKFLQRAVGENSAKIVRILKDNIRMR